ncbi:hypothetical protein Y1Q_0015165 [Alligator mississippiensis]|uniref:Uncharacterized protein n=1 Tax=Alligator mississippiensis TaxID=8496 RepID=A0A151P8U3_ALLMI|nr:hypothetical protein Y1Q_0015165 [Alligator mississippiensis]
MLRQAGTDMEEIQECEMDAKSTKTRPGTVTKLEQSISDLPMESMDNSVSTDSAEVPFLALTQLQTSCLIFLGLTSLPCLSIQERGRKELGMSDSSAVVPARAAGTEAQSPPPLHCFTDTEQGGSQLSQQPDSGAGRSEALSYSTLVNFPKSQHPSRGLISQVVSIPRPTDTSA